MTDEQFKEAARMGATQMSRPTQSDCADARQAGIEAYQAGKRKSFNPHGFGRSHDEWEQGWLDAKEMALESGEKEEDEA